MTRPEALVVDDDPGIRRLLLATLESCGLVGIAVGTCAEARAVFVEHHPRLSFLDVHLPDGNGVALLEELRAIDPLAAAIVMTAQVDTETIVAAIRNGAVSFMEKPFELAEVRRKVKESVRASAPPLSDLGIVGRSAELLTVIERIRLVAATPATTVLVLGESGTGKELVARAVHAASARARGPFVAVNCAALGTLLEMELFGYEKGSFTGASPEGKKGIFEAAAGGTVFLDEISETTGAFQAALLRVLQEKKVKRIGGTAELPVDVRVVASTNRDLAAAVASEKFRRDLFFRLHVVPISLPPLRARGRTEILLLARHFLAEIAREHGRQNVPEISAAAEDALASNPWPGNVRELRNAMERALVLTTGPRIEPAALSDAPLPAAPSEAGPGIELRLPDLRLESAERLLIQKALQAAGGNRTRAAELLGVNRQTLYNKAKAYGIALGD